MTESKKPIGPCSCALCSPTTDKEIPATRKEHSPVAVTVQIRFLMKQLEEFQSVAQAVAYSCSTLSNELQIIHDEVNHDKKR